MATKTAAVLAKTVGIGSNETVGHKLRYGETHFCEIHKVRPFNSIPKFGWIHGLLIHGGSVGEGRIG